MGFNNKAVNVEPVSIECAMAVWTVPSVVFRPVAGRSPASDKRALLEKDRLGIPASPESVPERPSRTPDAPASGGTRQVLNTEIGQASAGY